MESVFRLGGFQLTVFLNRSDGEAVLHLDHQHLVDAADDEGHHPPRRLLHLPGRLQGIVQQIPQNRAQIHASDVGAAGILHLHLEPDAAGLCRSRLAVNEVVRRLVPGPNRGREIPNRSLQFVQVVDCFLVLFVDEELAQDADMVAETARNADFPSISRFPESQTAKTASNP